MAMFDQPFQKHISRELRHRRDFHGVQTALHPHVRVTSLVGGNLGEFGFGVTEDLIGFTLGIPDLKQVNSISNYLNVSGQGNTAIGLTYPNYGGSKLVKMGSGKKKLPPPGVTDVSISTQSKGGFIFKATVNLKFYGKEQYNFIYQTMLRPGNPILIEYGQTRAGDSGGKDLGFFTELSHSRLLEYRDNFRNNTQLKTTRNSGAVVGLVSNFAVRLNEQNEYEASIDLINALEYMFTLSPDDTFLDYGDGKNQLAKSIRANFGIGEDEEWEPKDDKFFKFIIEDSYTGGEGKEGNEQDSGVLTSGGELAAAAGGAIVGWVREAAGAIGLSDGDSEPEETAGTARNREHLGTGTLDSSSDVSYGKRVILPGEWTRETAWPFNDDRTYGKSIFYPDENGLQETWEYSSEEGADYLMVSLDYFLNKLLNKIINESYMESRASLVNGQFVGGVSGAGNYVRVSGAQDRKVVLPPLGTKQFHCRDLRSVDPKKVIINNSNFYTGNKEFFLNIRGNAYSEKYEYDEIPELFVINNDWIHKEQYTEDSIIEGIFLNYLVIRSAFLSSKSVAEAIQKVLNTVNASTSGILDLKMKLLPKNLGVSGGETGTTTEFKITIYDEADANNTTPPPELYTFFENNVSEAVSYDFDFSLPSSVAAGVMASTFQPQEHKAAGGRPKEKAFIDYGYALNGQGELAITSLLDTLPADAPMQNYATMEAISVQQMTGTEREAEIKVQKERYDEYTEANREYDESDPLDEVVYSPAMQMLQSNPRWNPNDTNAETRSYIDDQGNMWYSPGNIAASAVRTTDGGGVTTMQYYEGDIDSSSTTLSIDRDDDPASPTYGERQEVRSPSGRTPNPNKDWTAEEIRTGNFTTLLEEEQSAHEAAKTPTPESEKSKLDSGDAEEERLYRQLLGYKELMPAAMKSSALQQGLFTVFPSSAVITIKLQGLDGFRFGDLFLVNNILPHPYDGNSIFMLTGYEHTISSEGWFTEIGATLIAQAPSGREPVGFQQGSFVNSAGGATAGTTDAIFARTAEGG